jgi:hypothetical protein
MKWCGTMANSSAEGMAVPIVISLKNCLESAEIISEEKDLAIFKESFVFPIAVGPTTHTNKGSLSDISPGLPED